MPVKYLYEFPSGISYDLQQEAYRYSRTLFRSIYRINEDEVIVNFIPFDNSEKTEIKVHIVLRADGKVLKMVSDSGKEPKEDPYLAAASIVILNEFKTYVFDRVHGDYINFFKEHYPNNPNDRGLINNLTDIERKNTNFKKKNKTDSYLYWVIFLIIFETLGVFLTLLFGFTYNTLDTWMSFIVTFVVLGLAIFIFNEVSERNPTLREKRINRQNRKNRN